MTNLSDFGFDPNPDKAALKKALREELNRREDLRCAAEESLSNFVELMWPILEPEEPFVGGWALDAICLPGNTEIITEIGVRTIGSIVDNKWRGRVLSFSHKEEKLEWQPVLDWMRSVPQRGVRLRIGAATLTLTENHPVFIKGRGYVRADQVCLHETVTQVFRMRDVIHSAKHSEESEILLPSMLHGIKGASGQRKKYYSLQMVRQVILSLSFAKGWRILQYALLGPIESKARIGKMPTVWCEEGLGRKGLSGMLGQKQPSRGLASVYSLRERCLQIARTIKSSPTEIRHLLQFNLHGETYQRGKQSLLRRWSACSSVSARVLADTANHIKAGTASLFPVFIAEAAGRAPRKWAYHKQQNLESRGLMSFLPLQTARSQEKSDGWDYKIVESTVSEIERDIWLSEPLYNIEVSNNNNYFANSILVHNCEHLEAVSQGQIRRLLINCPPGFTKSLLTSVMWPAWEWGPRSMPHLRYLLFSYAADLSRRDNGRCRDLLESAEYKMLWGDRFSLTEDELAKGLYSNDKKGWRLSSSTGARTTGFRGNRVILDDPHSVKQAESEAKRKDTIQWFRESLPNRFNRQDRDALVVIMQRVHEEDISGIIFKDELDYETLVIPMHYDSSRHCTTSIGWTDPRTEEGEIAWPERFSEETLAELTKEMSDYAIAGQYEQAPVPRGGGIIPRGSFVDWPPPAWPGMRPEEVKYPPFEFICVGLDTAFSEKKEADFTCLQAWGVFREAASEMKIGPRLAFLDGQAIKIDDDQRPKVMLIDGWQKRLPLHGPPEPDEIKIAARGCPTCGVAPWHQHDPKCLTLLAERQKLWGVVEWVVHTCRKVHADVLLIEQQARGHDVANEMHRLFQNEDYGIELVVARGEKWQRANAVAHLFSNGVIYAPKLYSPQYQQWMYPRWVEQMLDQIYTFPRAAHDDAVDTMTMCLQWLRDRGLLMRKDEADEQIFEEYAYKPKAKPLYDV